MINLKIPEFYRNMSIRKRLTIFLIIATLIPSILIFLAASIGINKINLDYNKKYMLTSEQMAEENLKSYVERINMTYLNILTDKEFFSILENKDSPDFEDKLNTRLKGLVTDYIQNVDIIDSQKNVIRILNSENVEQLSYETILKCRNEDNNWKMAATDENANIYYIVSKRLIDIEKVSSVGYIVFYVPEKDICNLYNNIFTNKDTAFILNSDNKIVSSHDKELIDSKFFLENIENFGELSYNSNRYYISKYPLSGTFDFPRNWSIVSFVSCERTDMLLKILRYYLIVLLLIIIIASPVLSSILSNKVVKPIGSLQKRMLSVGNKDMSEIRNPIESKDEIAIFEKKFDEMEVRINELIAQNNREKDKQRIAELNALQAQINPHFLYNTLDSILWLAEAHGQEDIVDIVFALSNFFEISLHNGKNYVTVEQEIEHVKSYITVEKIRFPDLFTVDFNIDNSILQERMIKIILQPVVENSIKHGLRPLDGRKGKITITGKKEDEFIVFEIIDNGVGFDPDTEDRKEKRGGYGLKNILTRIQIEYGSECGIETKSVIGKGTMVRIKIKHKDKFLGVSN